MIWRKYWQILTHYPLLSNMFGGIKYDTFTSYIPMHIYHSLSLFFSFSFGHCSVCPSSIYGFWLLLWLTLTEHLCHKWPRLCSTCRKNFQILSLFKTYHRVCNYSNTKGATIGIGTAHLPKRPSSHSVFSAVLVTRSLVLCVMFCRTLFIVWSFFFWCCLSFDLRLLITPLVPSNFSCLFVFFWPLHFLTFETDQYLFLAMWDFLILH